MSNEVTTDSTNMETDKYHVATYDPSKMDLLTKDANSHMSTLTPYTSSRYSSGTSRLSSHYIPSTNGKSYYSNLPMDGHVGHWSTHHHTVPASPRNTVSRYTTNGNGHSYVDYSALHPVSRYSHGAVYENRVASPHRYVEHRVVSPHRVVEHRVVSPHRFDRSNPLIHRHHEVMSMSSARRHHHAPVEYQHVKTPVKTIREVVNVTERPEVTYKSPIRSPIPISEEYARSRIMTDRIGQLRAMKEEEEATRPRHGSRRLFEQITVTERPEISFRSPIRSPIPISEEYARSRIIAEQINERNKLMELERAQRRMPVDISPQLNAVRNVEQQNRSYIEQDYNASMQNLKNREMRERPKTRDLSGLAPFVGFGLTEDDSVSNTGMLPVEIIWQDSPAWDAGLRIGDEVARVGNNDRPVNSLQDVQQALRAEAQVGKPLRIVALRGKNHEQQLNLTVIPKTTNPRAEHNGWHDIFYDTGKHQKLSGKTKMKM